MGDSSYNLGQRHGRNIGPHVFGRVMSITKISSGVATLALAAVLVLAGCDEGDIADGDPYDDTGGSSQVDKGGATGDGKATGDGPHTKKDQGPNPKNDKGSPPPPKKCNPPCKAPLFCSKAGICLQTGLCAHHDDCPKDYVCDFTTKKCVSAKACGSMKLVADAVPPNLLLNLDRSCSMLAKVKGTAKSKWQIAVDAIGKVLATYKGKIRFGLTMFPDTIKPACTQVEFPVSVGPANETKINALLLAALVKKDKYYPDGPCVTNIDTAMQQAAAHKPLADTTRDNFVALITDGSQANCSAAKGNKGTMAIITALNLKKVPTFVVGFGSGVNVTWLNNFAVAGGKPVNDPKHKFFKAENQATLDKALAAIAKATMGCIYQLKKVPPTMNKIFVFFDKKSVPRDTSHKNGWDYDASKNQVTFYGAACAMLKAGQVKDLDIVYGCNKPSSDGGPGPVTDGGPGPNKDGGPFTEAGLPKCKPGVVACKSVKDCPSSKYKCTNGCCAKIIE